MPDRDKPLLFDLETPAPSPADAPPIGDPAPEGRAMQAAAALAAGGRRNALRAWFWRLLGTLVLFFAGLAVWDLLASLMARAPLVAWAGVALLGLFVAVCLGLLAREALALWRLERIERFHLDAAAALSARDVDRARALARELADLYAARPQMRDAAERVRRRADEAFDADTALELAETALMGPLDDEARRVIESAARNVAGVTALVPLAFADVLAALTQNVTMIRRVAEIYGGRSGTLGAWRLTRAVMSHLVATGAVAVGDDLISSVGGGHLLSRLSRRFGEGLVNGALTARVGIAAIEVCRPLPFAALPRPRVTRVVQRALTGLFDRG